MENMPLRNYLLIILLASMFMYLALMVSAYFTTPPSYFRCLMSLGLSCEEDEIESEVPTEFVRLLR